MNKTGRKITTYTVDPEMEATMEKIRTFIGAKTNIEVIRRSIALMSLAVDSADEQKRVELVDKHDNVRLRVPLAI